MAKLYELIKEIDTFEFDIDEETGEILNAWDLETLKMDKDKKVENLCLWVKNLLSDAAAYKAEKDSFAAKEKAAKNKAESLKKYIQYALDGEKLKTDRVTVSYRKSESVDITDVNLLDSDLVKTQDPIADKTAIKKAIHGGRIVSGATLLEKQSMQIK